MFQSKFIYRVIITLVENKNIFPFVQKKIYLCALRIAQTICSLILPLCIIWLSKCVHLANFTLSKRGHISLIEYEYTSAKIGRLISELLWYAWDVLNQQCNMSDPGRWVDESVIRQRQVDRVIFNIIVNFFLITCTDIKLSLNKNCRVSIDLNIGFSDCAIIQ